MLPFLKYPGGKVKEQPIVEKYRPRNIERYFEPFVGGGAIFFNINCRKSFINDKSTDLYLLYNLVQKGDICFKELLRLFDAIWKEAEEKIPSTELFDKLHLDYHHFLKYFENAYTRKRRVFSKIEKEGGVIDEKDWIKIVITARKTAIYMCIRDLYNLYLNDRYHVFAFFILREYCYSSMFRFSKANCFNVPYGGKSYDYKYLSKKIEYIFSPKMVDYLRDVKIYNQDFEEFLNNFNFNDNDFIFLDPPYDSEFSTYDNNSFDRGEQIRLRKYLGRLNAKWMLIIKKTDFIEDLYKDFYICEYEKQYAVSFKNRNEKKVTHLLITNYVLENNNG